MNTDFFPFNTTSLLYRLMFYLQVDTSLLYYFVYCKLKLETLVMQAEMGIEFFVSQTDFVTKLKFSITITP